MAGAAITIITAFLVNLPLGRWRARTPKYSLPWFAAIHLSIPLIIWLRHHFHLGMEYIPFTLGVALLGQLAGSYKFVVISKYTCNRRRML